MDTPTPDKNLCNAKRKLKCIIPNLNDQNMQEWRVKTMQMCKISISHQMHIVLTGQVSLKSQVNLSSHCIIWRVSLEDKYKFSRVVFSFCLLKSHIWWQSFKSHTWWEWFKCSYRWWYMRSLISHKIGYCL